MKREDRLSEHFLLAEFFVRGPGDFDEVSWAYVQKQSATFKEALLINLKRLADRLEVVRGLVGKPLVVTSGYRCPAVNTQVGGAPNSYHIKGMAADLQLTSADQRKASLTKWVGGYGQASTFCHLDTRPYKARWKY